MSVFDADLILRVYQRDRAAEFYLYDGCYQYFLEKAGMFRYLPEHVKDDIFQESFLILWTEIQNRTIYSKEGRVWRVRSNGKAAKMTCNLRTFLISIIKNLNFKYLRDEHLGMFVDLDAPCLYDLSEEEIVEDKEKLLQSIDELLHKMSKHCVEILTMYYVDGFSLDQILMFRSENKSKDGLKTSKAKCLAQLKTEVKRRADYA